MAQLGLTALHLSHVQSQSDYHNIFSYTRGNCSHSKMSKKNIVSLFALVGVVCINCSKWIKLPAIERRISSVNTEVQKSDDALLGLTDEVFIVKDQNSPLETSYVNLNYFNRDNVTILGNNSSKFKVANVFETNLTDIKLDSNHDEFLNKTVKNKSGLNESIDFTFDIKKISRSLSHLQTNLFYNIPTTFKEKIKFLNRVHDNIMSHIGEKLNLLWPSGVTSRGYKDNDHHLDFPSAESALMTISFLTFAVYLIKLVLQVINILKMKKTTMYTPMVTSTARDFISDNGINFNYDNKQILNLMQSLKYD